mgnify:CR=1 FL=1
MAKEKKKKVCKLNKAEDKYWVKSFTYWINQGYSPSRADKKAFTELKKKYPRFNKCEKIK